jgi:hypothetical protein
VKVADQLMKIFLVFIVEVAPPRIFLPRAFPIADQIAPALSLKELQLLKKRFFFLLT